MRATHRLGSALGAVLMTVWTSGCGQAGDARSAAAYPGDGCPGVAGETVRWIVASTPGGGQDVFARLLEPFYEAATGAQIVIENRGGAGGAIGARAIRDAAPDGRTLGILQGTARLVGDLSEELKGLHPVNDFTVLGRVAVEDPLWLVGPQSGFRTIDDVLANPRGDSVLFALSDVGGTGFVFTAVPAELLGIDASYVSGYPGGREQSLAVIRGDVDIGGFSFESMKDRIEAGELTPILQISSEPVADHPALRGVPVLAGPDGVATRVARQRGADPAAATAMAEALSELFNVGRLVVGPPGLPADLAACLSGRLAEVASDSTFLAAASRASRTIRFADPEAVVEEARAAEEGMRGIAEILQRHIERARGVAPGR